MGAFVQGQVLKEYRKKHKVTQLQLARKIGISKNHLSAIERGLNKPSADILLKYCKEFDIPLNAFF